MPSKCRSGLTYANARLRGRLLVGLVAMVSTVVVMVPGAEARPWTRIDSGGMNVSDQVSLALDSETEAMDVAWRRRDADGEQVRVAQISPSGALSAPTTVARGWASVGSPALVGWPDKEMHVFWPGTRTLTTDDPTYGLDFATRPNRGSWAVNPTAVAHDQSAFSSVPAAAAGLNTPADVEAWAGADSTLVHAGFDPSVPPVGGYGRGYDQALAIGGGVAGTDEMMVAWCNEVGGDVAVARADSSTGSPVGNTLVLPSTGRCPASTRVPLASFPDNFQGPGDHAPFYVAASSPDGRRVLVYTTLGSKIAAVHTVAAGSSVKQQIALTQTIYDRVWVAWRDSGTGNLIFRRSARIYDGTRVDPHAVFGAPVRVSPPKGQTVYQLAVNAEIAGTNDRLFAVATTSDDNDVVSTFATTVSPGLTLEAGTRSHIARKGFRVLDAGKPVHEATVTVRHRALTTDKQGYAKSRLPPGTYKVTASKTGYHNATVRVRLR